MQASEVAIRTLTDGGVTYFAGMVGSTNTPLVAAVGRTPGARYIPVRHEQVAVSIMDATGRLSTLCHPHSVARVLHMRSEPSLHIRTVRRSQSS